MNFLQNLCAAGTLLGVALLSGPAGLQAQETTAAPTPGVAQAFGRVFAEHEAALAAAHGAENRRYQAALSGLAARAKQSGDADALYAAQQALVALATQPAPPTAATLVAMGPYVGGWDCLTPWGTRSSFLLQADGSFRGYGERQGTWTVEGNQLTLKAKDWSDVYNLPAQNGVLKGHTADGSHDGMQLTRRGMGAAASLEAGLVGDWDSSLDNGDPTRFTFAPDGSMIDSRQLVGSWAVVGNELLVTFDAHHEWLDTYELPVGPGGVTNGHNPYGGKFTLTRKGRRTTTATASVGKTGSGTGTAHAGGSGGGASYFGTTRPATESGTPAPRQ